MFRAVSREHTEMASGAIWQCGTASSPRCHTPVLHISYALIYLVPRLSGFLNHPWNHHIYIRNPPPFQGGMHALQTALIHLCTPEGATWIQTKQHKVLLHTCLHSHSFIAHVQYRAKLHSVLCSPCDTHTSPHLHVHCAPRFRQEDSCTSRSALCTLVHGLFMLPRHCALHCIVGSTSRAQEWPTRVE